ncbi:FtsX-like permease family protein [Candidatus Lokiarchaeum ossiferum]|uniref:FtsX-like permease family protein n=1 Tax=Candidatus Lokiarchaeum ossiferum TaxID=2951803 RepID=UPI00352ED649
MLTFNTLFRAKDRIYLPLLVGVVISISLYTGMNFFFEASQKANFSEAFKKCNDVEIYQEHHIFYLDGTRCCYPNTKFCEIFRDNDALANELVKNSLLKIKGMYRMGAIIFDRAYFVLPDYNQRINANVTKTMDYFLAINATKIQFDFFETDFYQSETFHDYFKIINGRIPQNSSEYLVDYTTALKLGLDVGDYRNITVRTGNIWQAAHDLVVPNLLDYSLQNMSICGIYLPQYYEAQFNDEIFYYSYTYGDFQNGRNYKQTMVENPIIFCWSNFSLSSWNHQAASLIQLMRDDPDYNLFYWRRFFINGATGSSYVMFYQRETIDYKKINQDSAMIVQQMRYINNHLPLQSGIRSYVEYTMGKYLSDIQDFRTNLFFMSIPMILGSILIGSSFQKSLENKRLREVFLLRCKGVDLKRINLQILMENISLIVISWIFGVLLGNFTFYLFYAIMGDLFLDPTFNGIIYPNISANPLIISAVICCLEIIVIYYPLRKKIKKQHFNELNHSLNSPFANSDENFEVLHDKIQKISKSKCFIKQIFDMKKKKSQNISGKSREGDSEDVKYDYEPDNDFKNETFQIKSIFVRRLITLALVFIPLFFISITIYSYFYPIPDNLKQSATFFKQNPFILEIILMSSMLLMTVSFSRFIFQDSPSLFIRVVRWISHIFVRDYDTLISMEIIGKKKWLNNLILYSCFISLLVFTNFMFQNNVMLSNTFEYYASQKFEFVYELLPNDKDALKFYNFFFKFLIVSSFFILIESAILQILLFKENHIINQSLMTRGLTTSKLYRILLLESIIIFLLGSLIGVFIGIFYGLLNSYNSFLRWNVVYLQDLDLIIDFVSLISLEIGKILVIILGVFVLSTSLFFIYAINRKKLTSHPNAL